MCTALNMSSTSSIAQSIMTEYGRVHFRQDNKKWQAHDVYGAYVGQFPNAEEAKEVLEGLAAENDDETNDGGKEGGGEEKQTETKEEERSKDEQIRGSDSMLEIKETPAPWTLPGREKKSRGEKIAEDANWLLRKSKNAYWAVAAVAGLGTLTGLAGVWGNS